jgi:hypothetical protein
MHCLLACLPAASKVRLGNLFLDLTIPSEKLDKLVSRNADYHTVYPLYVFEYQTQFLNTFKAKIVQATETYEVYFLFVLHERLIQN